MPDLQPIVFNTTPLIAIIAAVGNLDVIRPLYSNVIVPREVVDEIVKFNTTEFAVNEFNAATWLEKIEAKTPLDKFLGNALDAGEAAVIQTASLRSITRVAIDEIAGRRMARLYGLKVTGALGILLKARQSGYPMRMRTMIDRMLHKGIYLSSTLVTEVLKIAGEN